MLMDMETLSSEEAAIRAKETELRLNVNGAWVCMTFTALFAVISGLVQETSGIRGSDGFLAAMMGFIALIFAGLSVMAWSFAIRDRRLLEQLRAIAFAMTSREPGSVWPPPPSALHH